MKRSVSMLGILVLVLSLIVGPALAQEEEYEAMETETEEEEATVEMEMTTTMMPPMGAMNPMSQMGPGMMRRGMMPCMDWTAMRCCGTPCFMDAGPMGRRGMAGPGVGCCTGHGRMEKGSMMCDPICKALHELGCICYYEKYADELELSKQQVKDLKAIFSAHRKAMIRKNAEVKIAEMELKELTGQDIVNFGEIKGKITQIGSLKQDIQIDRLASIEKAQKVLTEEQLAKFKSLKKGSGAKKAKPVIKKRIIKKTQ